MLTVIASVSLAMSVASFGLYLYVVLFPRAVTARGADQVQLQGDAAGLSKLAEALAKLVDAMGKAGPSALSFFGAMVFMVIALLAARP